jgi:signal transduction histidine kinase
MRHALDRVDHDDYITLKDGSTIQVYTVPLPDGGVMISYDDITATVQVENALREKNSALEEAERLKLDFLANVSYQLRTPLNAIMGFAEILSNQYFGELNERQGEYTRGITEAGNRLLSLIDDILDISTIEAGYLELRPDTIDVKAMAEHIYNLTNEWARKENVRLALNCSKNIGQITADERRLKQVMLNLIRNAITYTKEDGKVEITVKRKKDGHVMIAVSDNGEGISEEDQKKVFEPFEQGSKGKMNKGVGLGLSLVRDIVKLHGGEVSLESAAGKGTTVTLLIPNEVKENALEEYIKEKIA